MAASSGSMAGSGRRSVEHSQSEERAFYRRQATRLLQLAEGCKQRTTAEQLLKAAEFYLDKLEELPGGPAAAA
jgi:hypothetical protein